MTIQLDLMEQSLIDQIPDIQEKKEKDSPFINESTREESIENAREEILNWAVKLNTEQDPYLVIRGDLQPIINYQKTNKLLKVNDGVLEEYFPLIPIGPYLHADDVIECIREQVCTLLAHVMGLDEKEQWIGLRLAREVSNGLGLMIEDYSHRTTYDEFDEDLKDVKKTVDDYIHETSIWLNASIDELVKKGADYTDFELWELPAESYPKELILERFSDSKWVQSFLVSDNTGRVPKEALRDAIIAVSTSVTKEEIDAYLDIMGYEDRSTEEWIEGLWAFRSGPNDLSLIEYFGLPISADQFEIDEEVLEQRPYLKSASPQGQCEAFVLADLDSAKWWQCLAQVHMSEKVMADQLNTLFQNPYEPQLFHTDKYLSFLTVAATSLAYLDSCGKEREAIEQKIVPLIFLLEDIAGHAHKMYPKDFVESYKGEWLTLIGHLKSAVQNPEYDTSSYFRSLFAHPDQTPILKKRALSVHQAMRPSEYLSRKVGYWNRYYLTNDAFLDDDGRLKDPQLLQQRVGTLFFLEGTIYEVKRLILCDGFVCQICMPFFWDEDQPVPIKVVYQGTIPNRHSEKRDVNPIGPGYGLWQKEGMELLDELVAVIKETNNHAEQDYVYHVEFTGHSLGASDAQNAATYFTDLVLMYKELRDVIYKVDVHTFNPAGIPEESSDQFYTNILSMENKLGNIRHSMVKNDIVEISAQNRLGANFKDTSFLDIMEVSNLGVYHIITNHCLYAHSATDTILPHRILDPKNEDDAYAIHRYLFGVTHSWKDLTGHAHDMIEASPITKIAFNSLYLVGLIFGIGQIKKVEEAVASRVVSPLIKESVTKLEGAETSYLKKHVRESIQDIWQAFTDKWRGTQILEGTG